MATTIKIIAINLLKLKFSCSNNEPIYVNTGFSPNKKLVLTFREQLENTLIEL